MIYRNTTYLLLIFCLFAITSTSCQGQGLVLSSKLLSPTAPTESPISPSGRVSTVTEEALPPLATAVLAAPPTGVAATLIAIPSPISTATSAPPPTATAEPLPTLAAASPPARLRIPRLGLDAAIESVGLTAAGAMDTPTYVEDVAWYNRGPTPGEIGKAVIAGHLDAVGGVPAVFYRIGSLQAGDTLTVVHENGAESTFVVTHQTVYPYEDTPFNEVFGFSLQSELNLITCTGSWNSGAHNYTNRLVVFARKINTSD